MSYVLAHTCVRIDLWVVLAAILLIATVIFFIIRLRQMKKTEAELEKELKQLQAES